MKQTKATYIDSYVEISYKISTSTTSSPTDTTENTRARAEYLTTSSPIDDTKKNTRTEYQCQLDRYREL